MEQAPLLLWEGGVIGRHPGVTGRQLRARFRSGPNQHLLPLDGALGRACAALTTDGIHVTDLHAPGRVSNLSHCDIDVI
jgi:hypothetical protein